MRDVLLQREHIKELVRLVNEELRGSIQDTRQHVEELDAQLGHVRQRLERLYDALETGKLVLDDLAPRIQELRQQQSLLLTTKAETTASQQAGEVQLLDAKDIVRHLDELQKVLAEGTVIERRTFLKSFVRSIVKQDTTATIRYTVPIPSGLLPAGTGVVLDSEGYGGQ